MNTTNIKPIIAIAGNARSGKDTLTRAIIELLKERGLTAEQFAFADPVRQECEAEVKEKLGLDVWNIPDDRKSEVRPFLLAKGAERREEDNLYWVRRTFENISKSNAQVAIISDLRYPDELSVLLGLDTFILYITRYKDGKVIGPGSDDEAKYNPNIRAIANRRYQVPHCENIEELKTRFVAHGTFSYILDYATKKTKTLQRSR